MNQKKVLVAAGLALVLLCGWNAGKVYSQWKARQCLVRARGYFQQGRLNEATLSIRASLQAKPDNPEAFQQMAEMMEALDSAEALPYRKAVAGLRPQDPQARIDLANCALRFNRLDMARDALAQIPERQRFSPDFFEVQAKVATTSGDVGGAIDAYSKLLMSFPGNPLAKGALLNLAQIWLKDGFPGIPEQAAARLEELSDDAEFGISARRLMVRRALRRNDAVGAFQISNQLVRLPKAEVEDNLQNLDLMRLVRCPLEGAALEWLERSVKHDPARIARVAEWVLAQKGPQPALAWLERLPKETLNTKPVPIVLADCYSRLKNWAALEKLLTGQNWGRLEAQRTAMLTTAYRNTNQDNLADLSWKASLLAARNEPGTLASLARLAASDNRVNDAMEALWDVPPSDPGYQTAQKQLFLYYRQQNDAAGLLRLTERTLTEHPDDRTLKIAVASLLLVRDQQVTRAARLAREVFEADPKPILNAAVYAYSLFVKNPTPEGAAAAAAILDARTLEEKRSDDCLVYYGLILTACHRYDEARACFSRMNRSLLFPETLVKVKAEEQKIGKAEGNP